MPLGSRTGGYSECQGSATRCYSSGDIFHLEVCILNELCGNGRELFHLEIGEEWHCDLSHDNFVRLKSWLSAR